MIQIRSPGHCFYKKDNGFMYENYNKIKENKLR